MNKRKGEVVIKKKKTKTNKQTKTKGEVTL